MKAPHPARAGFTLLEVVISLTILALITTTLFSIIRGSVRGSVEIEKLQQENDQVNHFIDLCRATFQALPTPAALSLKALDPSNPTGSQQELGIAGMPTCFSVGLQPVSYSETILALQPDSRKPTGESGTPRLVLSISRTDILPVDENGDLRVTAHPEHGMQADAEDRYWLPLLRGVTSLKWRFWKEDTDEWLEEWEDTTKPDLVEMQLLMDGRTTPLRMVFALPTKTLRTSSGNRSATPPTTTTAAGTAAPRGR
jgi:prepilin-type N-terminal cleavage/methylation domain-containing protein